MVVWGLAVRLGHWGLEPALGGPVLRAAPTGAQAARGGAAEALPPGHPHPAPSMKGRGASTMPPPQPGPHTSPTRLGPWLPGLPGQASQAFRGGLHLKPCPLGVGERPGWPSWAATGPGPPPLTTWRQEAEFLKLSGQWRPRASGCAPSFLGVTSLSSQSDDLPERVGHVGATPSLPGSPLPRGSPVPGPGEEAPLGVDEGVRGIHQGWGLQGTLGHTGCLPFCREKLALLACLGPR